MFGDFNINLLDFGKNNRVQSFVNLMFRFGMIPTINKTTHVTRHTATAINHVFTNTIMGNIEIKMFVTILLSSLLQKTKETLNSGAIHF